MFTAEHIAAALHNYRRGYFPMAVDQHTRGFQWHAVNRRSLLPIETLHISRSLKKLLLKDPFEIRFDSDFDGVICGCAEPRGKEQATWINDDLRHMMLALHKAGYAHSAECWQDGRLVGGVYGMALGAVFAGESMFSRVSNASKVALVHLCARLWRNGFQLFDTQYINPHVKQFGVYEIPGKQYQAMLPGLVNQAIDFTSGPASMERAPELLRRYLSHKNQTAGQKLNNLVI
jgi:leucyl/phenylalanyl-tRNA--protein transferase